ncbi:MAG: aminomethyltransferase family protein, partial [Pseudomonadota bacterium]
LAQWHDFDLLAHGLPEALSLVDQTEETGTILLTGPASRGLLKDLTDGDLTTPWLTHQSAVVAGAPVHLARISFAGELGWEILAAPADMPAIWDALADAGAKPFGMLAMDSLRIEKGYRTWKGDLSSDYSLLEMGLDRFVKPDKPADYPGRASLLAERQQGSTRRAVTLTLADHPRDPLTMSPIWRGNEIVGEVTSAAYGHRTGQLVALAMINADHAEPGNGIDVEVFGERVTASIAEGPALWDPENLRIRA